MRNKGAVLLTIRPPELKLIFEEEKESSCAILLNNNTSEYIAFKVKTTSPWKYSVVPNAGIIMPKATRDFRVTMQRQERAPPYMACKDKFLVQSTIVPFGTTDKDITTSMFEIATGKYIEQTKLRVTLVSPLYSPVLSPLDLPLKQGPENETVVLKDNNMAETSTPHQKVAKDEEEQNVVIGANLRTAKEGEFVKTNDVDLKSGKESKTNTMKEEKSTTIADLKPIMDSEDADVEPAEAAVIRSTGDTNPVPKHDPYSAENLILGKEIEEIKSRLNQLRSKLSEAETTISKLAEERNITIQEREKLKAAVTKLQSKGGVKTVQVGFPPLFVCMVGFLSVMLGYILQP